MRGPDITGSPILRVSPFCRDTAENDILFCPWVHLAAEATSHLVVCWLYRREIDGFSR
jgi:hypothetical protein